MDEIKNWFIEKTNKIDKSLVRLIKKKRERAQINKNRRKEKKLQWTLQIYKIS